MNYKRNYVAIVVSICVIAVIITKSAEANYISELFDSLRTRIRSLSPTKPCSTCTNPVIPAEPSYCSLENIQKMEIADDKLPEELVSKRASNHIHGFKIGKTTLIGMSIGESDPKKTKAMATTFAKTDIASKNYCTWYLNTPDAIKSEGELSPDQLSESRTLEAYGTEAMKEFMHHPIGPNPKKLDGKAPKIQDGASVFAEFKRATNNALIGEESSFASCARESNYIALGCNGMNHRGPIVFGMLLAFSGCKSENVSAIVQHYWPLKLEKAPNENAFRLNAFEKAHLLGQGHPNRQILQDAFRSE